MKIKKSVFVLVLFALVLVPGKIYSASTNLGTNSIGFIRADKTGKYMFISDQNSNNVIVYSVSGKNVVKRIDIGAKPSRMDVNYEGSFLYVGSSTLAGITIININDLTITGIITTSLPVFDIVCGRSGRAYYTVLFSGSGWEPIYILDLNSKTDVTSFGFLYSGLGSAPIMVLSPDKNLLFAGQRGISPPSGVIFDISSDAPVTKGSIETQGSKSIGVSPDGRIVYTSGAKLLALDTISLSNIQSLTVGPDFAILPANGNIYAASGNSIVVINPVTYEKTNTLTMPVTPDQMAFSGDNDWLFCFSGTSLYYFYIGAGVHVAKQEGSLTVIGGANGYVNPSKNEAAQFRYKTSDAGTVTFKVYTLNGELVRTISTAGSGGTTLNNIYYDCKGEDGATLASGIYIVKAEGPGLSLVKKIAIIK
ncbi:MAG: hypothetical protein A2452_03185 [Candidatus Firestonebacteria bacterium RIFOXYC2_FULL_39_67]|nr:MAG: hypothetical protein A2536_02600 [Candidatus Firestonebacteria bacterium RIFOXYD2_FULL_39_29]OGF55456.1 MAG: hypothetical protein A2452_03185 [Candidatus Firestonebacteria bacterium RIFOXYC2_FULL_39_67]